MRQGKKSKRDVPRPVVRMLTVEQLVPTPDNRRRPMDEAALQSLAESIKNEGLLQPLVVRRHPTLPDRWEIRAGERRWRAARLAGLKEVPVIVRQLDDEAALAVTITENLQRLDLLPLEEAETIQLAFDRGYDVKAIASILGKPIQHVARRASLTRLTRVWRVAIQKPNSHAGRLSPAHLELIARLPEPTQNALAEDDFGSVFSRGFPTVDELRKLIDQDLHSLSAMPWPLDDETLDPRAGACVTCPKRSSQQVMLFAAITTNGKAWRNDRCLDPKCFERKQVAYLTRCEATLRDSHTNLRLVQLGFSGTNGPLDEVFHGKITRVYHPTFVKASDPRATPAMPLDGPKVGKLVYLDLGESVAEETARRSSRPRGADGKPLPMTMEEKRARLQKRRNALFVKGVTDVLKELTPEKAEQLVSPPAQGKSRRKSNGPTFNPLPLLVAFGTDKRADYVGDGEAWKEYDFLRGAESIAQAAAGVLAVVPVWLKRLRLDGGPVSEQAEDARRICGILGIDAAVIEAGAAATIPEPKSWEREKESSPATQSATKREAEEDAESGDEEGESEEIAQTCRAR